MNEKSLFATAVRVGGLYCVSRGFNDLLYTVLFLIGSTDGSVTKQFSQPTMIYGIVYFLAGLYLIRGAPLLQNFAFATTPERQLYGLEADDAAAEDAGETGG